MSEGYVLVVDDEPNIAMCLEYLMKRQGFAVRVAPDGETALDAMREREPDVMLLDVMMPRRDGYDICQTVRATPAWNDVRIIMLSGGGGRSSARRVWRWAPTTTSPSRSRPTR